MATWTGSVAGRPAPAGHYIWRIIAGSGKGSLLPSTGTRGTPAAGVVVVG